MGSGQLLTYAKVKQHHPARSPFERTSLTLKNKKKMHIFICSFNISSFNICAVILPLTELSTFLGEDKMCTHIFKSQSFQQVLCLTQ